MESVEYHGSEKDRTAGSFFKFCVDRKWISETPASVLRPPREMSVEKKPYEKAQLEIGYRVFVCDNMAFHGDFTPVLAKHSKHFNLQDAIDVGLGRMQRNFEPMRKQVEGWRLTQLTDDRAKLVIYRAFVEGDLEAPKHLIRQVHNLYCEPQYPEFQPRTLWSLTNAFTSAFKELDPMPQFKATAKLGAFLATLN